LNKFFKNSLAAAIFCTGKEASCLIERPVPHIAGKLLAYNRARPGAALMIFSALTTE
jgi:hypothetical protein